MSMTTAGYDGRRREGFEKKGNIDKWEEKSKKDSLPKDEIKERIKHECNGMPGLKAT